MAVAQSADALILTAHDLESSPKQVLLVGLVGQRDLVLLLLWSLGKSGRVAHFPVCRVIESLNVVSNQPKARTEKSISTGASNLHSNDTVCRFFLSTQ